MSHFRKRRVVIQKHVRCSSLSQEWGKCFNLNSVLCFLTLSISVVCWPVIFFIKEIESLVERMKNVGK